MTEEENEKAREKYNTMEKGLQLKPTERALIVISDAHTNLVATYSFRTEYFEELEILATSLVKKLDKALRASNVSQEEQLLFLEKFFEQIKGQYKERHLNNIL